MTDDPRYDPNTPGLMRQAIEDDQEALDSLMGRFHDAALDRINEATPKDREKLIEALRARDTSA